MKNYCVIQHNYSEFLGLVERQLEIRDIGFSYLRPFVGQEAAVNAVQYDALFLLGGSLPTTHEDNIESAASEKAMIDMFLKGKRPTVGFGYGGLLVAEWAGATPAAEPAQTAYWTTARMTEAGQSDPLAQAVDGRRVLVMYNGAATLPDDVEPIVEDENGNWIAIRPHELVYGMLFRPELKPGMIEDMIMEAGRETVDNIGEVLATARQEWENTQKTTDQVIIALVAALDLMTERKKPPVFKLNVES